MIKVILLGLMFLVFNFLIYEIGYVHGFEKSKDMNQEKGETNETKSD